MPVLRTRDQDDSPVVSDYLPVTAVPPAPRWDDHVEGWHMDEASNTTRVGIKGRDFVDVNSSVAQSTGGSAKFDNAAYIQNSSEELRCTTTDFRFGGDFTVLLWIQNTDTFNYPNEPIIRLEDGSGNADWDLRANSSAVPYMRTWDSVAGSEESIVYISWALGAYRMLVLTYDAVAKQMESTVNGDTSGQRITPALTNGLRQGSTRLRLGDDAFGAADLYWRVDEMHFFDVKKDDPWIVDMWNSGDGRLYPT